MELGDLEFKAEDFYGSTGMLHAPDAANEANRILREKLAKAPEVTGWWNEREWDQSDLFTHRARLVCIEEIGK